jgi:hypothetical protein
MPNYHHQLVWPPFKGKAHKVVETSTGRSVGLYRTPEGARRKIVALEREAAASMPRITVREANAEVRAMVEASKDAC